MKEFKVLIEETPGGHVVIVPEEMNTRDMITLFYFFAHNLIESWYSTHHLKEVVDMVEVEE
jgi:hypothetical protein